jgi:hypothetical protein
MTPPPEPPDGTAHTGRTKWPRGMGNRKKRHKVDILGEILRANRRKMVAELHGQGQTWDAIAKQVGEVLKIRVSVTTCRKDLALHTEELRATTTDTLRSGYDALLKGVVETHFGQARKGSQRSAEVVIKAVKEHSAIFGARLETAQLAAAAAGATVNVNVHEAILAKLEQAAKQTHGPDSARPGSDAPGAAGEDHREPDGG